MISAKVMMAQGETDEQLSRVTGHAKRLADDLNNDSVPSGLQVVGSDSPDRSGMPCGQQT